MTTYLWTIAQLSRNTSDGFVVVVHYNVSATEEELSASTYGTISYSQEEGTSFIPYESLTQEVVVGWVQDALGKDAVEASLQGQIDDLKAPVQQSGLPWTN